MGRGMWRREAIEMRAAGNTIPDEDHRSRFRAIAGMAFVYLLDEVAPRTIPVDINAYKAQRIDGRRRDEVGMKMTRVFWRSALPMRVKLENVFPFYRKHQLPADDYHKLLPFPLLWFVTTKASINDAAGRATLVFFDCFGGLVLRHCCLVSG